MPVDRCSGFNCISVFWLWYVCTSGAVLPTQAAITLEAFLVGSNLLLTGNTRRKEVWRHRNYDLLVEWLNKLIWVSKIEWSLLYTRIEILTSNETSHLIGGFINLKNNVHWRVVSPQINTSSHICMWVWNNETTIS